MINVGVRCMGVVVALCVSLSWFATATSDRAVAMSPPSALANRQDIRGGGIGFHTDPAAPVVTHTGNYSTTGQLGRGRFVFDDGDAAGTARFTRADGRTLTGTTEKVPGQCGTMPDSTYCLLVNLHGSADIAQASVRLTVLVDFGHSGRTSFLMTGRLILNRRIGYAMVGADGTSFTFGGIDHAGDAHTTAAIDIDLTNSRLGYWIVNTAGQIYGFGDARHFTNANTSAFSAGEVVTTMSATPTANGYWLFTSKGRVVTFGDATFFGDLRGRRLNGRIVGSVATPTGKGYYMVASDGGVFAFGDAKFRGSMGAARLNQPVVGLVPTPDNSGYWLVASDGGVFSFDAPFYGSMGGTRLNRPVVAMVRYGAAYLMVASDGGVFNFSRAPFFGSLGGTALATPVVNAAATG